MFNYKKNTKMCLQHKWYHNKVAYFFFLHKIKFTHVYEKQSAPRFQVSLCSTLLSSESACSMRFANMNNVPDIDPKLKTR